MGLASQLTSDRPLKRLVGSYIGDPQCGEIYKNICPNPRDPKSNKNTHVFNFIWAHPEQFKIITFEPGDKRLACPDIKLDIDTQQDYEKICRMDVNIEMEAYEIVAAAKTLQ